MDQTMLSQYLEKIGLEAFPTMDIAGLDQLQREAEATHLPLFKSG